MSIPRPQIIVIIGLAVAALVLGAVWAMRITAESTRPWQAGDCLTIKAPEGFEKVACSSATTTHLISSVLENQSRPTRFRYPCEGVNDGDSAYWQATDPNRGRVFCLHEL